MTYHELRCTDAGAFTALAVDFRCLAARLWDRAEVADGLRDRLGRSWAGAAAQAALVCADRLWGRLLDTASLTARCDQLLAEWSVRLQRARALLADAEALAETAGLVIDAGGQVHQSTREVVDQTMAAGPRQAPDLGLLQVCAEVDRQVADALRLATEVDLRTCDGLRHLAQRLTAGPPTLNHALDQATDRTDVLDHIDALGSYDAAQRPADVAACWSGLSDSQRWSLMTTRPELVGGRDGIPAADRDTANRLLLATQRHRLLDLRDEGSPPLPWVQRATVDRQLAGVADIEERLGDPTLPRAYLMEVSTVDDGRAVVAVGDPDRATDVVTYVPGTGVDLSTMDTVVWRADLLHDAATRAAPSHEVSVAAWLGYDAPDGLGAVMAEAAHDAEPALDDFADGLRASHDGDPSHNVFLGHSYGSLVVGVTARDRGLDADDLVFVGSPGVGVDRAADLGLPGSHVWSSTAANDPVQHFAPGWGQVAMDIVSDAISPLPTAHYGDATPDLLLWHGLNPSTAAFGGNVFGSDPDGGHSGYWRGASLTALAHLSVAQPPTNG